LGASGVVRYNVQVAVDTEHHLIVTHEVTNSGSDRAQLANIAAQAKAVLGFDKLEAVGSDQRRHPPDRVAPDDARIFHWPDRGEETVEDVPARRSASTRGRARFLSTTESISSRSGKTARL
jgi:hypothetical protein